MSQDIPADQIEIIQEFLQESREMLDQLEPTIVELGEGCQTVDCWEARTCDQKECARFGKSFSRPCWLETGYLGEGNRSCAGAQSAQDCQSCAVFRLSNGDTGTINAIFRLFHSMKGSAGFLDLNQISRVAHAAESLLDLVRSGKIRLDASHVQLLCQACDFSRDALDRVAASYHDRELEASAGELSAKLERAAAQALEEILAPGATPPLKSEPPPARIELGTTEEMRHLFVVEAREQLQELETALLEWPRNPGDRQITASLFRALHSFKGNCGLLDLADLERLAHQMESLVGLGHEGRLDDVDAVAGELLPLIDLMRDAVTPLVERGEAPLAELPAILERLQRFHPSEGAPLPARQASPEGSDHPTRLGQLLVARGLLDADTLESALRDKHQKLLGERLVEMGKVSREQVDEALAEQRRLRQGGPTPPPVPSKPAQTQQPPPAPPRAETGTPATPFRSGAPRQDIRVDLEKLDQLINLVGELVIAENMVVNNPDLDGLKLESFRRASRHLNKVVRELQEVAMGIRMIPVSGVFRRMVRLVHDLSVKSGKKVELRLSGEETEVDKTVIELMTDPLVHLLRNAVDHGLESPADRIAAGKPEKGRISLSARHEEGEVWITLEDDGRGLNRERILAKAIAKGLVQGDGSELSDKAVNQFIFAPGFSTAETVTDVSGRGVGLDVVRQNLEKIKGRIDLTSRPGAGSRFTLRLPLTLGIIDGMMVRVGTARCIVPTLAIREAFRPRSSSLTVTPDGVELVKVRGLFYPVTRLHEVLGHSGGQTELEEGILILVEGQGNRVALFVDELLGQQQTVIKGLSPYLGELGNTPWFSGCTILGDGAVCLILDINTFTSAAPEARPAEELDRSSKESTK